MRRKLFETPQQHVLHAFHKTSKVSPVASAALHALHTRNIEASTALQTHIPNHPKLNPQSHHVSSTQVQKRKYTKFIWIYSIGGSNIWQQIGTKIGTRLNQVELPVEPGPPILGFSSNVELRCRRPWIFGLGWFPAVGTGNCQKMSNHVVYSFYRPPNWSVTIWRPTPNTLYKASRALPTCHELESLTLCQTLYINSLDQLCDIFWMFSLFLWIISWASLCFLSQRMSSVFVP